MPIPGSRETIHQGRKFAFERLWSPADDPDAEPIPHDIVRHPGAVCIVAILQTGHPHNPADNEPGIVLIRNHRPAVGKPIWELPAGTLEPDEPPSATAPRELIEETGYEASTLTPVGRFYTSPGMSDELMHAFAATDLRHVGQRLEPDERIEVHPTPLSRVRQMLDENHLLDAKSILTIILAQRAGILDPFEPNSEPIKPGPQSST